MKTLSMKEATKIAKAHVPSIETLEPRNRDSLDFHDVGVRGLYQMLDDAYKAGQKVSTKAKIGS